MIPTKLFWSACVPTRIAIALLAPCVSKKIAVVLSLIVGLSFLYLYLVPTKMADQQLKWAGEDNIWWNHLRPVHGILWILYALNRQQGDKQASRFLWYDVIVGSISELSHRGF